MNYKDLTEGLNAISSMIHPACQLMHAAIKCPMGHVIITMLGLKCRNGVWVCDGCCNCLQACANVIHPPA